MKTSDLSGITGDISIFVTELSRLGCSVHITEWVDSGRAAVLEAQLPDDTELAEQCLAMIEQRRGPVRL